MTLLSFGFSPVFFSVMAFCIISRSKLYPQRTRNKVIVLILLTFFICFLYPLTKVYLVGSYGIFDKFYLFCFISTLIAIAINVVILTINGAKNERN